MNHVLSKLRLVAGGLAVAGLVTSCSLSENNVAEPLNGPSFKTPPAANTTVSGFAWDPEAFLYNFFMCNPPNSDPTCPAAPVLVPGVPGFANSTITGAALGLFDAANPGPPAFLAAGLTPADGSWQITDVTTRGDMEPPFFPYALPNPAPGGTTTIDPNGPPGIAAPVAPANYFPTMALQPIDTHFTQCLDQSSPMLSDSGILQTVAKWISMQTSTTVTPDQLFDGKTYGGVAVIALTQPFGSPTFIPAVGAMIDVDDATKALGTVYYINWAPPFPGVLPSPGPADWQSARGFFVDNSAAPYAPLGIAVLVLNPLPPGPPPAVMLSFGDSPDSFHGPMDAPHPWAFPPLPPLPIAPHQVNWVTAPGLQPGAPPPPPFVCLPPG